MAAIIARRGQVVSEPRFVETLLNDPRTGWLWLVLRVWVGWQWVEAAEHKIFDPKWVQTGEALKGFWLNAVQIPETGRPAIAFD